MYYINRVDILDYSHVMKNTFLPRHIYTGEVDRHGYPETVPASRLKPGDLIKILPLHPERKPIFDVEITVVVKSIYEDEWIEVET